VLIGQIDDLYD